MNSPASTPPSDAPTQLAPTSAPWRIALLWAGVPLCLFGLFWHRLWEQWPSGRFAELIGLSLLALAGAAALRLSVRWSWASGLAAFWFSALVLFSGPLPVAATLLFAVAGIALGSVVSERGPVALLCACGIVLAAGTLGWLLPLPIHSRWLYLALCVAAVLWRRRFLLQALRLTRTRWQSTVDVSPSLAAFAVLVLGLATTGCWLPTLQFDDLAYHLRLPWELMDTGRYTMDPETHVWVLGPWIGDVVQAIPQVIAGAEARGPVNALWIVLTAAGLWQLTSALSAGPRACWLAVALYASMPLTASLGGSLQTETATAALLVWLGTLIARGPDDDGARGSIRMGAVLAGGLIALKLTAAGFAILLFPWAAWRYRRHLRIGHLLVAVAIVLLVAGSSYAYATALTGNPVFPLFNEWFKSPYLPATHVADARWHDGFNVMLPWNLTFDTDRYQEIYDGGAGFALVALAGAWLLALTRRATVPLAIAATALIALPLMHMQYLRYVFPALVLLVPALVAAGFRTSPRLATWLLVGVCVLNLAFQANSHWMLRTGVLKQAVVALGRDEPLFAYYVPERNLIAQLRVQSAGRGNVLLLDTANPNVAELGRHGRTVTWYDPSLTAAAQQAETDPSGGAWARLLLREGVSDVLLRPANLTPAQRMALQRMRATRRAQVGEAEWWSLPVATAPP